MRDNRIRTALALAGGFHQNAVEERPEPTGRPNVVMVERFENGQWVTKRTVWNDSEQRYQVAA
jgi:hypothetical protein